MFGTVNFFGENKSHSSQGKYKCTWVLKSKDPQLKIMLILNLDVLFDYGFSNISVYDFDSIRNGLKHIYPSKKSMKTPMKTPMNELTGLNSPTVISISTTSIHPDIGSSLGFVHMLTSKRMYIISYFGFIEKHIIYQECYR